MRISTFFYTIKQGLVNIWKNKMFSLASIATMTACIFLFGLFYSIVTNFQAMVKDAESGVAGIVGGYWKSYNDIPSLVGYMSMALIVYKLSINWVNRFFQYTNKVSYEWYLIHILIFSIYFKFARGILPFYADWVVLMLLSYVVAIGYHKALKKV